MYTHILVPTDGSELSGKAVAEAVKLAKLAGAKLTAFYAMPQFMPVYYGEAAIVSPGAMESAYSQSAFEEQTRKEAEAALSLVLGRATEAGVNASVAMERSDGPAAAILKKVVDLGCDAIVMASHGRKGLSGLLLGSETVKVLTHCKIPVLVVR